MAHHLTLEERDRIAQLRHQGADQKEIAGAVGRCPSTISRELRRNRTDGEYYAAQAQREAEWRRQERPLVRKMEDPEMNEAVRYLGLNSTKLISVLPNAGGSVSVAGAGTSTISQRRPAAS